MAAEDEKNWSKMRQGIHAAAEKRMMGQSRLDDLEVGDTVRVALRTRSDIRAQTFRKSSQQGWSKELYKVEKVLRPHAGFSVMTVKLEGIDDRRYHRDELQKVDPQRLIPVMPKKTVERGEREEELEPVVEKRPVRERTAPVPFWDQTAQLAALEVRKAPPQPPTSSAEDNNCSVAY